MGDITASIRNRVYRGSELLGVKTENEGQSLTFLKVKNGQKKKLYTILKFRVGS